MKKYLFGILLTISLNFLLADDHMPISYGMEGYQCDYKEGVTLNDLVEFTNEDLNPYADKSWSVPYSGFYLTPFLRSGDEVAFDVGWVGLLIPIKIWVLFKILGSPTRPLKLSRNGKL